MGRLFDISELEADIFSEDELQAIDNYAHITNMSDELAPEGGVYEEDVFEEDIFEEDLEGDLDLEDELEDGGDFPALELELSLEDGQVLACQVVGVFLEGEKEYIALHPKDDTEGMIHIMVLEQGEEDSIRLLPIENEDELEMAALAFHRFMDDSRLEYDDEVVFEEAVVGTESEGDVQEDVEAEEEAVEEDLKTVEATGYKKGEEDYDRD